MFSGQAIVGDDEIEVGERNRSKAGMSAELRRISNEDRPSSGLLRRALEGQFVGLRGSQAG